MSENVVCCLIAIQTNKGVTYRVVNDSSFTIGRSEDCVLQINDSSVSRIHLAITSKGDQIWIRDNNSTFGTTINGKKLAPAVQVQIKPTDRIVLGSADATLMIQTAEMKGGTEHADTVVGFRDQNAVLDIQVNQTLQEAKKQAAQIIYESEFEAEKKVQAIHAEAKAKLQQSELAYQTKVEEAQKMSEKLLAESQKQGHEIIQQARKHAQAIRDEIDKHADGAKKEALERAAELIKKAHADAEVIREQYVESVKESAIQKARKEVQTFRDVQEAELAAGKQELQFLLDSIQDKKKELEETTLQAAAKKALVESEVANYDKNLQEIRKRLEADTEEIRARAEIQKAEYVKTILAKQKELDDKVDELSRALNQENEDFAQRLANERKANEAKLIEFQKELDVKKAEYEKNVDLRKKEIDEQIEALNQQFKKEQLDFEKKLIDAKMKNIQELREVQSEADQKRSEFDTIIQNKKRELHEKTKDLEAAFQEEKQACDRRIQELKDRNQDELKRMQQLEEQKRAAIQKELDEERSVLDGKIKAQREEHDRKVHEIEEANRIAREKLATEAKDLLEKQETENKEFEIKLAKLKEENAGELDLIKLDFNKKKEALLLQVADQEKELQEKSDLLKKTMAQEQESFDQKRSQLEMAAETLRAEVARLQNADASLRSDYNKSKEDLAQIKAETEKTQLVLNKSNAELKETLSKLSKLKIEVDSATESKRQLQKDYESQILVVKSDLEKERLRLLKNEEEYFTKLKLENAERIAKLKNDAATEIVKTKEYLAKEIVGYITKELGAEGGSVQWSKIASKSNEGIQMLLQKQAYAIVGSPKDIDSSAQEFKKKQKKEKFSNISYGAVAGAALLFFGQLIYSTVVKNQTPLKDQLAQAALQREEELKKRKFQPKQTIELQGTYVDAVIYTKNFDTTYLNSDYQAKWSKAVTAYLLNSWRIEEDQSIQIVSSVNALVKQLVEKREAIHPDFVDSSIAKMRELEAETVNKVKGILGTDVKFEAFKKFEKKFFMDESLSRAPAHAPAKFDAPPPEF